MKKTLLKRFQELAGIKPLYETGKLNNFGSINEQTQINMQVCYGCVNGQVVDSGTTQYSVQSSGWCGNGNGVDYYYPQTHSQLANCTGTGTGTGSDPDCFACVNNSIDIVPLSQITYPSNNITMCGYGSNGLPYYVDQAALNNAFTAASGSGCGSIGTGGPGTGGGGSCISSSFNGFNQTVATPAATTIMNAPASNTWKSNTIDKFITFNCNKIANRYYHFNDQVNSGNFQGNQLARKTAKRDALLLANNTCCPSLGEG